jgi:mRNA interferase MazF
VTSNPYSDTKAVELEESDFVSGSLQRTSYARPGKLFSANSSIMERIAGELNQNKLINIIDSVIDVLRPLS